MLISQKAKENKRSFVLVLVFVLFSFSTGHSEQVNHFELLKKSVQNGAASLEICEYPVVPYVNTCILKLIWPVQNEDVLFFPSQE